MSSAIVMTILITLMVLVVGSFVFSAWLARRRHMRVLAEQNVETGTTGRMMVVVQLMDGSVVGLENQVPVNVTNRLPVVVPSAHLPHHWYNQQRTIVSVGLLLMLLVGFLIQTGAAGDALLKLTQNISSASAAQLSGASVQTAFQPLPYSASARIVRVDSAAADQYATLYQYQVWSYSSCSGISLEEVMNSYGRHYIASDVLQVEQNLGVWDTYDGLTGGEAGMAKTAAQFGFQVNPNPPRTLQALIATANEGYPVIVGNVGHILVVKGGDANYVYLVDSAPANRVAFTYAQFMAFWNGQVVQLLPPTHA
jgi:hypothetical protein